MKTSKPTLLLAALMLVAAGSAQAKYLCDAPPTPRDARACQAAAQGPAELRRFIQRMQVIENLAFDDYVNEATRVAWDQRNQRNPIRADANLAAVTPGAQR